MSGTPAGRPTRVSRRQLVAGMGAAAFGGVIAGGAGGFAGARSTESEAASGGVGGRPLEISLLDAKDQTPEIMTSSMRKFVADRVAAVFSPFLSYTNVETPIIGRAGTPLFHVNTFQ